jgi:hypothetical protein
MKTSTGPSVMKISAYTTKNKKIEKVINPLEKMGTLWITATVEKCTYLNSIKSSEHNT